jgi:four helix bundle protein
MLVGMRPYERLLAWRYCHRLTLFVYRVTESFPKTEVYGITSQMRRAAASAATNIAEGSAKRGTPELRRFLDVTLGSLSELSYLALLARDLRLFAESDWQELDRLHTEAGKTTMGLYKAVARRTIGADTH